MEKVTFIDMVRGWIVSPPKDMLTLFGIKSFEDVIT